MVYKYLYIDDTTKEQAEGTISGLMKEGQLEIVHDNPSGNWDEQIKYISENIPSYSGLILDQRLDQGESLNGNESKYRGTSLAQEIRVLSKERKVKDIPIILLSAEINITSSFDSTGVDLFDLVISKEHIASVFESTRFKLIALAKGYEVLLNLDKTNVIDCIEKTLGLPAEKSSKLDPRFIAKLEKIIQLQPHLISNFIVEEVLNKSGLLISEELLAARLGVNIKESEDWSTLLNKISDASYSGVFSDGWKRWWMIDIELWWESWNTHADLRLSEAEEKVKLLKAKYELVKLITVERLEFAKSNTFWTICMGTDRPIDVIDGLLIDNQDDLFPWQDRRYVSYFAALQRTKSDLWKDVSVLERPKLDQLQKIYKRERVRR